MCVSNVGQVTKVRQEGRARIIELPHETLNGPVQLNHTIPRGKHNDRSHGHFTATNHSRNIEVTGMKSPTLLPYRGHCFSFCESCFLLPHKGDAHLHLIGRLLVRHSKQTAAEQQSKFASAATSKLHSSFGIVNRWVDHFSDIYFACSTGSYK